VTAASPLAGLVAPVTVAEIELDAPATVTHVSMAAPGENDGAPRALVLVRLHAVPMGTIVVDAPAGEVDATSCAEALALGPFAYGISRLRNRRARYPADTRHPQR
jgi:hypothetical protein